MCLMSDNEMRAKPLTVDDMRSASNVTHEWFKLPLSGECHPDEKRIYVVYRGNSISGTIEGFCAVCEKLIGVFAIARKEFI